MNTAFFSVPDIAFERPVQQYGFSIGRPVHTALDLSVTLLNYIEFAKVNN